MLTVPHKDPADRTSAARRRYASDPKWKAQVQQKTAEYRLRNQTYVNELKARTPCADCGISYPHWIMQFDHLGTDKSGAVSVLAARPVSLTRLQAEVAKCEIVCANCHFDRTHRRRSGSGI